VDYTNKNELTFRGNGVLTLLIRKNCVFTRFFKGFVCLGIAASILCDIVLFMILSQVIDHTPFERGENFLQVDTNSPLNTPIKLKYIGFLSYFSGKMKYENVRISM
jgi:hypothetical protein